MKSYPALFVPPSQLWPDQNKAEPSTQRRSTRPYGIRALTEEQMDDVAQRYRQGESGPTLAAEFNVSVGVIYRALYKKGVAPRSYVERPPKN